MPQGGTGARPHTPPAGPHSRQALPGGPGPPARLSLHELPQMQEAPEKPTGAWRAALPISLTSWLQQKAVRLPEDDPDSPELC